MARKGKLLAALDAHKGRDFEAEKRKKQLKNAEKRKRKRSEAEDDEDEEQQQTKKNTQANGNGIVTSEEAGDSVPEDFGTFSSDDDEDNSASDSEQEDPEDDTANGTITQPASIPDASASEAEEESDLALSDLSEEDREDIVPHQRMTINNGPALLAARNRISIVSSTNPKSPFHHHNSLISTDQPANTLIPDPMDDETRELMFYKIARDATVTARSLLKKEKIPFSRPTDYFAEMVKTDDHMDKVKKKLYDEAASKKAAEEARRLRDAKKFGKKVQIAKEQERAKEKRDTLNKIQELKRKRKSTDTGLTTEGENLFQEIDVDSSTKPSARDNRDSKRQKRDSKFGFGGKKKYAKSGTAESSGDLSAYQGRRMKGGDERGGRGGGRGGRGGARGASVRGGRGGRGGGAARRPGKSRRVGGGRG